MPKRLIMPPRMRAAAEALNMSPGIASGGHVFLTGATGSGADGEMPSDPASQFEAVFAKIESVLREARLRLDDIVEMTSYHVELQQHFDVFDRVRLARFRPPYPAWTAVEVAGLRRAGALVEVRVVAEMRGHPL